MVAYAKTNRKIKSSACALRMGFYGRNSWSLAYICEYTCGCHWFVRKLENKNKNTKYCSLSNENTNNAKAKGRVLMWRTLFGYVQHFSLDELGESSVIKLFISEGLSLTNRTHTHSHTAHWITWNANQVSMILCKFFIESDLCMLRRRRRHHRHPCTLMENGQLSNFS